MAKKFRYQHILSAVEDKAPESLLAGEIAVNKFAGKEKLFIQNSEDEIIPFVPEHTIDEKIEEETQRAISAETILQEEIDSVSANVTTLGISLIEDIAEIGESVDNFENTIDTLAISVGEDMAVVETNVDELSGSVETLSASCQESEYVVAQSLNDINSKVNTLSSSTETFSGSVVTLSGNVNTLSGSVETFSGSVVTLSGNVNTLSGSVETLSASCQESEYVVAQSLNDINSRINESSGNIQTLQTNIDTLSSSTIDEIDRLDNRINVLSGKTITGKQSIKVNSGSTSAITEVSLSINSNDKVLSQDNSGLLATVSIELSNDSKTLYLKGKNGTTISTIDTTSFVKDGMLDSVTFDTTTNTLKFIFNTESGKSEVDVPLGSLVDIYTVSGGSETYMTISDYKVGLNVDVANGLASYNTVSALTENLEELSGNVKSISTAIIEDLEELSGSVETFSGSVVTLSGNVNTLSGSVETFSGSVVTLSGNVNTLSGSVETLSASCQESEYVVAQSLNDINSKVNTLSSSTETFSGSVVTLSGNVNTLSGSVVTLSSETKENLIELEKKTGVYDYSKDYLTFIAQGNVRFSFSGSTTANTLSYSLDNGETWVALPHNTDTPTISSGSSIMWKGTGLTISEFKGIGNFVSTGQYEVEGNIMSLIHGDNFATATTVQNYEFYWLFRYSTGLTSAENLVLPATTLADDCYQDMFESCTGLTTAPELPATTLASSCYEFMFMGCTSLNYIKCLATNISATDCTYFWVEGVAASGTFVKDATMTSWTTGVNGIPTGWTIQDDINYINCGEY